MKKSCVLLALVVGWLVSCHQETSTDGDLLYRRWRLFRTQAANSGQIVDTPTAEWTITEFRSNGTIVYGSNGRYTACCSPNRFLRVGTALDFVNVGLIPIPETDNPGACNAVDCIRLSDTGQIITLTPELLSIGTDYGVSFYQPY